MATITVSSSRRNVSMAASTTSLVMCSNRLLSGKTDGRVRADNRRACSNRRSALSLVGVTSMGGLGIREIILGDLLIIGTGAMLGVHVSSVLTRSITFLLGEVGDGLLPMRRPKHLTVLQSSELPLWKFSCLKMSELRVSFSWTRWNPQRPNFRTKEDMLRMLKTFGINSNMNFLWLRMVKALPSGIHVIIS